MGALRGSPCHHQAFFTERYLQEHPEAHDKIEKLKDLIAWQVNVRQQPGRAGGGWQRTWVTSARTPAGTQACGHQPGHTHPRVSPGKPPPLPR